MFRNRHRGRVKKHHVKRSFLNKLIGGLTTAAESEDYDVPTEDEIWTLSWANKKASTAARPVVTTQVKGPNVGGLMSEKVGVKTPATWEFNVRMTSSTRRASIEGSEAYSLPVFNYPQATTNAPTPMIEGIVAYSPPGFNFPQATTTQAPNGLIESIVAYSPPGKIAPQPVVGATEEVTSSTEGTEATTAEASVELTTEVTVSSSEAPTTGEKITELLSASTTTEEQTSEVVSTTEATVASSTEQKTTELPTVSTTTEEQTSEVVTTTEATVASSTEQKTTELPTVSTTTEEQISEVVTTTETTVASSTEPKTTELPTVSTTTEEQTSEVVTSTEATVASSTEQKTTELPTVSTTIEEQTSEVVTTSEATVASSAEQTTEQQTTEISITSSAEHTTEALPTFSQTEVTGTPSVSFEAQTSGELQFEANTKDTSNEFRSMITQNQEFMEEKFKLTSAGIQITSSFDVSVALTETTGKLLEMTTLPFTTSLQPQPPYKLDNDITLTPVDQIKFEETTESHFTTTQNVEAEQSDKPTVTHVPTDIYDLKSSTSPIMEDEAFTTLSIDDDIEDVDEDEVIDNLVGMHFGKKTHGSSVSHKSQYLSTAVGKEDSESIEDAELFSLTTTKKGVTKHRKHHWHFGKKKTTSDDESDDVFTEDVFLSTVSSASGGSTLGVQQGPTIEDTSIKGSGATLSDGILETEEGTTAATTGQTSTEDNKSTTETEGSKLPETTERISPSVTSSATEETVVVSKATAETESSQPEISVTAETEVNVTTETENQTGASSHKNIPGRPSQFIIGATSPNGREYVEGYVSNAGFKYYGSGNGPFSIAHAEETNAPPATIDVITERYSPEYQVSTETTQRTVDMISAIDDALKIFTGSTEPPKGMPEIVNETFVSAKANQHPYDRPVTVEHHTDFVLLSSMEAIPDVNALSGMADMEKTGPKTEILESTSSLSTLSHSFASTSTVHDKVPSLNAENLDYDTNNDTQVTHDKPMPTKHQMGITITYENGKELLKLTEETLTLVGSFEHRRTRKPKHKWFGGKSKSSTRRYVGSTFTSADEEEVLTTREADITETLPATSVSSDKGADGNLSKISSAAGTTFSGGNVSKNYDGTTVRGFQAEKEFTGKTEYKEQEFTGKLQEDQKKVTTVINTAFGEKNTQSGNIGSKLAESKENPLTTSERYVINDSQEHTTKAHEVQTQSEKSLNKNIIVENMSGNYHNLEYDKNTQSIISINIDTTAQKKVESTSQQSKPYSATAAEGIEHVGGQNVATEQEEFITSTTGTTLIQKPTAEEFPTTPKSTESTLKSTEANADTTTRSSHIGSEVSPQVSTFQKNIPDTSSVVVEVVSTTSRAVSNQKLPAQEKEVSTAAPKTTVAHELQNYSDIECVECKGNETIPTEAEEFSNTTKSNKSSLKSNEDKGGTTATSQELAHVPTSQQHISETHPASSASQKKSDSGGVGNGVVSTTLRVNTESHQILSDTQRVATEHDNHMVSSLSSTTTASSRLNSEASASGMNDITSSNVNNNLHESTTLHTQDIDTVLQSSLNNINQDKPTTILTDIGTIAESSTVPLGTASTQSSAELGITSLHQSDTTEIISTTLSNTEPIHVSIGSSEVFTNHGMVAESSPAPNKNFNLIVNNTDIHQLHIISVAEATTTGLGGGGSLEFTPGQKTETILESNGTAFSDIQNQMSTETKVTKLGDGLLAESTTRGTQEENSHSVTEKVENQHEPHTAKEQIITTSQEKSEKELSLNGTMNSNNQDVGVSPSVDRAETKSTEEVSTFSAQSSEVSLSQSTVSSSSQENSLVPNKNYNLIVNDTNTHQLHVISVPGATTTNLAEKGEHSEFSSGDKTLPGVGTNESTTTGSATGRGHSDISSGDRNETNLTKVSSTTEREEESALSDVGNKELGGDLIAETSTEATTKTTHQAGAESTHNETGKMDKQSSTNETWNSNSHGVGVSSGADGGLHVEVSTSNKQFFEVSSSHGPVTESSPALNKTFHLIVNNTDTHQLHIISLPGAMTTSPVEIGKHSEFSSSNKTLSGVGTNESTTTGSAGDRYESNGTKLTSTTEKEEESALSEVGNKELGGDLIVETSTEDTTKATHEAGAESTHSGTGKIDKQTLRNETWHTNIQGVGVFSGANRSLYVLDSSSSKQSFEVSSSHGPVAESSPAPNKNFNLIVNNTDTHQLHIITLPETMTTSLVENEEHLKFPSGDKTQSGVTNESTSIGLSGGGHYEISSGNKTETHLESSGSTVSNVQEQIFSETNATIFFSTTHKAEESAISGVDDKKLGDVSIAETSTDDTTKATHEAGAESTHGGTENADILPGSSTTNVLTTTISHELSSNSQGQSVAVGSSQDNLEPNKNYNLIVNNTDTHQLNIISMTGATLNEQSNTSPGGESLQTSIITVTYSTSQGYSNYTSVVGNIGSISEEISSISEHATEPQTTAFANAESSQIVIESTTENINTNIGDSSSVSVLTTELLEHTSNDLGSSQTEPILTTQEGSLMSHSSTENIVSTGVEKYTKELVESDNIQTAHISEFILGVTTPLEEMFINNTPRIILPDLQSSSGKGTLVQDIFVLTESPSGKPTDLLQEFEGKPESVEESMKKPGTDENATKISLESLAKMVETLSHAIVEFSSTSENSLEIGVTSGITETGHTATTVSTGTSEVDLTSGTTESVPTSSHGTTESVTTNSPGTTESSSSSSMSSVSELSESTQHVEATTNGTKSLKHAWNKMINKVKQIGHGNHSTTPANAGTSGQDTSVPMTSTQVSLMIDSHTQLIASVNAIVIDESKIETSPTPTIFMETSNSGSTKQTITTVAQETSSSSGTTNKEDKHITLPAEHVDANAGTTEPQQVIGTILQSLEHKESVSSSTSAEYLDHTTSETSSSRYSERIDHAKEEDTHSTQVGQSTEHSTQGIATALTKTEASEHVGITSSISSSTIQSTSDYLLTTSSTFNFDVAIEESSNFIKNTSHVTPVIILHSTVPGVDVGGAAPVMPVNIKLLLEEAYRENQTRIQSSEKGLYHSDITTVSTTSLAMKEEQSFSPESASLGVTEQDHGTATTGTSASSMADEGPTSTVSAGTTTTSTLSDNHESKAEELKSSSHTTMEGGTTSNLLATTISHESSTFPSESSTEKTSSLRPEDTTKSHETLNSAPSSGETTVSAASTKSKASTKPVPTIEKHVLTTMINPPILLEEHEDINMHHLSTKADVTTLKHSNEHSSTEPGGVSKNKITSAPGEHKEQTLEPAKEIPERISETELTSFSTARQSTTLEDMHTTEEVNYVTNARSHASEILPTHSFALTSEHELGTTFASDKDIGATLHSVAIDLAGVTGDHTQPTLEMTSHVESSHLSTTESETSHTQTEVHTQPTLEMTSHVESSHLSTTESETSHTQTEVISVESSTLHDWNTTVTNGTGEQVSHLQQNMSSSSEAVEGVHETTNTFGEHSESTHLRAEITEHSNEHVHSELTTEHKPVSPLDVTTNHDVDKNTNAPGEHSKPTLEPTQHSSEVELTEHSKGDHGTPKVLFSTNTPGIIQEEHQNLNMHHFAHTSPTTALSTTISEVTETTTTSEVTETTTTSEHHKATKKHKHLFKHKSTTSSTTDDATSTSTTEAFYLVGNETCKYTPVDKSKYFNMTKTTTRTTKSVYINLPTYFLNSTWPVPRFELYYPTQPEETTEIDESFDRTLNPHAYRSMKYADFINITEFPTSAPTHVRLNVSAFKDIPVNTTITDTTTEMTTVTTTEATTTHTTTTLFTTTESTTTVLTTTESTTESTEILTTTTSEATTTTEATELSTEPTTVLTTTTTCEPTTILTTTTICEPTTILTTTTTSEATTTLKSSSPPTQAPAVTIANVVSTGTEKPKTCNLEKDKSSCICSVDSMVKDLQEKSRNSNISAVLSSMCEIYIPLNASGIKVGRCVNRLRRSLDDYDWDTSESSKPKREVIASADIKDVLNKDIQLDESESHRFVTSGSQVRMICADGKNFTSKNYNIKWTVGKDTPLTGAKTLETETGDLIIQNVEPSDCGNYTCTVSNHQVGMRTFQHKLSVVALPTMDINTTILYEVSVDCLKEDEELLRVYFNTAIGNMLCGKEHRVCSIDIVNCTCINKQKKYLSVVLAFHMEDMHVIVPTLNTTQCNVACQMKIYAKLISVIVNNILVFETQPIIYKHSRDVMLTPSKDASLAAHEITDSPKLIIACSAGYGLLGDKHICSACEKNTYNNGGQARCLPCPPHHFQPYSGSRLCIKCTSPFQDPACMNMMVLNVNRYKYYALVLLASLVVVVLCIVCIRRRRNRKRKKRTNAKNKDRHRTHYDVEMQAVETHDKETITLSNKPSSTKRRRRATVKARAPPIPVQREDSLKHAPQTVAPFMMTNCMGRRTPPTPPTPDFD